MKSITKFLPALLILFCLPVSVAEAQVDPDPDGIGIYFDVNATIVSTSGFTGSVVQAYLIGTRLSQSGNIDYWETRLCPDQGASITGVALGSYNYAGNMPGDPCWSCIALYPEPPLPAREITWLASLSITIEDGSIPVGLYVSGEDRYRMDGSVTEIPLHPSSGSADLPVAVINGPAPVSVETGCWGRIKSMYR